MNTINRIMNAIQGNGQLDLQDNHTKFMFEFKKNIGNIFFKLQLNC